jgi:hypothetical protein
MGVVEGAGSLGYARDEGIAPAKIPGLECAPACAWG